MNDHVRHIILFSLSVLWTGSVCSAEKKSTLSPIDIEFRRQAVRRIVFDKEQSIPLCVFKPEKVVNLSVEYPEVALSDERMEYQLRDGRLRVSAKGPSESARWIGGFNPYATYDVEFAETQGEGAESGIQFATMDNRNRFDVLASFDDGQCRRVHLRIVVDGEEKLNETAELNEPVSGAFVFRVQMMGSGLNVFVEQHDVNRAVLTRDYSEIIDLRRKEHIRTFESRLLSRLDAGDWVEIEEVAGTINPGIGQSEICAISNEDGSPLIDEGRLWFLITIRGRHLPHPMQGVYSMNPTVFDIRFEGMIVFDRGDGLLRNEVASHIYYDRQDEEWRGFTVGFSCYGDPDKKVGKQIWAVSSQQDPRKGFSVMKSKPVVMPGAEEDPHVIYDPEDQKWRVLVCTRGGPGFPVILLEAKQWDGPYKRIAGPAKVNGTGGQLQKIGSEYYAIFGSADRKFYVYSYPDLEQLGALDMVRPPWDDKSNTRSWPNILPLPDGYPFPYLALSMDRVNYPGVPGWVYGSLYLYHGYPKNGERAVYEYSEKK